MNKPSEPENEIVPGAGAPLLAILESRWGVPTEVLLADGELLLVHNAAWGRDFGDEWEHVTTNCSPYVAGAPVDFFLTSHVVKITDPDTGKMLFERTPHPGESDRLRGYCVRP
jgi:hypothetical protein